MSRPTYNDMMMKIVENIETNVNSFFNNIKQGTSFSQLNIEWKVIEYTSRNNFKMGLMVGDKIYQHRDDLEGLNEQQERAYRNLFGILGYVMRIALHNSDDDNFTYYCREILDDYIDTSAYIRHNNFSNRDDAIHHIKTELTPVRYLGNTCVFTGEQLEGRFGWVTNEYYYKEGYKLCGLCGKEHPITQRYCDDCIASMHRVRNYTCKPHEVSHLKTFQRNKNESELLFFGVELEIDRNDHDTFTRGVFADAPDDFFYFKSDASLNSSTGVETVTVPASFSKQKQAWAKFFKNNANKELFKVSRPNQYGLHVHISRTGFTSPKHLINFAEFFMRDENTAYISEQAGRDIASHRYCKKVKYDRAELIQGKIHGINVNDRNSAVNLRNPMTIEVRCCASTDDYEVFMQRLNFIHNVFKFTRHRKETELTVDHFKAWLETK